MDKPKVHSGVPTQEQLDKIEAQTSSVEPGALRRFGDYLLLEEISRGGMGVVYRALQVSLGRVVAVKMLLGGPLATKDFVQRFRTESAAAASLQHPNIVAIHEVGFVDGQHFFAMDYVEGLTLAQLVAKGPLPARQAATYLRTITEAIHYAHERNVLHRDLKPSNVLIDSASNQPRVTDFGLAKRLEAETDLTLSGQVLGSPNFMSPEQATAKRGTVGKRSDVYSLGAILYHLLTGRPPFQGETLTDVLQQVMNEDPLAPHLLTPRVPHDLETICLKCLEKDPSGRYQTAQELADELNRFLRDEPIVARPINQFEKTWRWCRRKPAVAGLTAATIVLLLALAVGSSVAAIRINRERGRAEAQAYAADMNLAQQARQEGNLGRVRALLLLHAPRAGRQDLRGWEWRQLWQSSGSDELFTLGHHSNAIRTLAFSLDGQHLATGGSDKLVKIWDPQGRKELASVKVESMLRAVLFAANGKQLLTADDSGTVKTIGLEKLPELAPSLLATNAGKYLALSPDGRVLAVTGGDALQLWDLLARQKMYEVPVEGRPWRAAFSRDGGTLAIGTVGGEIVLWSIREQRKVTSFAAHKEYVLAIAFSPDGQFMVSGGWDHAVRIWAFPGGQPVANLAGHTSMVDSVAFSPDGSTLATASRDQTVRLWDVANWQEKAVLRGHLNEVWAVAFAPDGRTLATSSKDESIKFWSAATDGRDHSAKDLPENVRAFSFDGRAVLAVEHNSVAVVWDCIESREIGRFSFDPSEVSAFAVLEGGGQVALAGGKGSIAIRDTASGKTVKVFQGHPGAVKFMSFSPDGLALAIAGEDGQVDVWRLGNGVHICSFHHPDAKISAIALSGGAKFVAAGDYDGSTEVWDLPGRQRVGILAGHKQEVRCIRFCKNTLLTASLDATIKLWDLSGPREISTLTGQLLAFYSIAISPDGQRLAGGGADGIVKVWELNNFQEVATLKGHRDSVVALGFSPDGNTLVSLGDGVGAGGQLVIWRAPTLAEIDASEKGRTRLLP